MYSLWPAAGTRDSFNWDVLTSHNNLQGEQRFQDQYWRSNISPSERYVQSVVGSTQYRIETKIRDFDNIYLKHPSLCLIVYNPENFQFLILLMKSIQN